jgi:hypothetical protein
MGGRFAGLQKIAHLDFYGGRRAGEELRLLNRLSRRLRWGGENNFRVQAKAGGLALEVVGAQGKRNFLVGAIGKIKQTAGGVRGWIDREGQLRPDQLGLQSRRSPTKRAPDNSDDCGQDFDDRGNRDELI